MNEWRTAKELVKEFGISEPNLRNMAGRKQVRSKFVENQGKKIKLYSYSDLAKRRGKATSATDSATSGSSAELSQNNSAETSTNYNGDKYLSEGIHVIDEMISGFNLSEEEAKRFLSALRTGKFGSESVLKAEQALAKMRENLTDEKHLIDIRTLQHDLENLFSATWTQLKEQIDAWQLRYNFPAKQAKEMLGDYSKLLEKIREKAKALGNAPSSS